ncbi:hypothetical protein EOA60_18620, partial [Mesorhizobium sp. M1A.F.Ca.IN.020.06.1.1]|uniref:hypothetical protein n=1 Tax=Mesorhizobium sp. M1A.F.Ca.IN.020.06.1.1 TaxID=2496765 RepID=UPI000FD1D917
MQSITERSRAEAVTRKEIALLLQPGIVTNSLSDCVTQVTLPKVEDECGTTAEHKVRARRVIAVLVLKLLFVLIVEAAPLLYNFNDKLAEILAVGSCSPGGSY